MENLCRLQRALGGSHHKIQRVLSAARCAVQGPGFGDCEAADQLHKVGGLLLWALFLAYLFSWWLVGLGTRWDAYEALLIEATSDE